MRRVFVTGAGRGLGLEFVRQCLLRGDRVFAGCRDLERSPNLQNLLREYADSLTIIALDVRDQATIAASAAMVRKHIDGLDILINNAGINAKSRDVRTYHERREVGKHAVIDSFDAEGAQVMFQVNTIAPLIMVREFFNLLQVGNRPRIVNISSMRGSLTLKMQGGNYAYCASKAALNMVTLALGFDMQPYGITAIALDPGWVRTDMGGEDAPQTPAQSVQGMLQIIDQVTVAHNGCFLRWDGEKIPW